MGWEVGVSEYMCGTSKNMFVKIFLQTRINSALKPKVGEHYHTLKQMFWKPCGCLLEETQPCRCASLSSQLHLGTL